MAPSQIVSIPFPLKYNKEEEKMAVESSIIQKKKH